MPGLWLDPPPARPTPHVCDLPAVTEDALGRRWLCLECEQAYVVRRQGQGYVLRAYKGHPPPD